MTMQMLMADERRAGRNEAVRPIVAKMFRQGKSLEELTESTDTLVEDVRGMLKAESLWRNCLTPFI